LTDLAAIVIKGPSQENVAWITHTFQAIGGIDRVVGTVDVTHVSIKELKENHHVYVTRKDIAEPSVKLIDAFCA
jgi:rRNA processing protein Gar1